MTLYWLHLFPRQLKQQLMSLKAKLWFQELEQTHDNSTFSLKTVKDPYILKHTIHSNAPKCQRLQRVLWKPSSNVKWWLDLSLQWILDCIAINLLTVWQVTPLFIPDLTYFWTSLHSVSESTREQVLGWLNRPYIQSGNAKLKVKIWQAWLGWRQIHLNAAACRVVQQSSLFVQSLNLGFVAVCSFPTQSKQNHVPAFEQM